MQITITTAGDEQLISDLKAFGSDFPRVLDCILRSAGAKFQSYVRKSFLSGQMLGKRTGKTQKDVRVFKVRGHPHAVHIPSPRLGNVYEHPGGADIRPKTKKALRWTNGSKVIFATKVHLKQRPFMSAAAASFDFDAALSKAADDVIEKELRKRGLL